MLARLKAVWPARCAACGGAARGRDLCGGCAAQLLRNDCCCPRCAEPLALPAPACGRCLRKPPPYASAWVPYRYAAPLDLLLQRQKFAADLAAGRVLGELWCEALTWRPPTPIDCLVPVPLASERLAERGYNQALELARPLARALRIPLSIAGLSRVRSTESQSGLDRKARQRNVRGAFAADPALRGKRVVVVDDVMTTGATLGACAHALQRLGTASVEVWALARAGRS